MNPMSIMAQAEKLGIPELQRSIQDGVVPAFIGVPLLQEKVKKAKQMQMGMAAQQPKRPSVAEQVGQEAQQATIAGIMEAQALRMQGEMGQTGGISDSLPKPEGYAKGGPIAFAARGLVPGAPAGVFTVPQAYQILQEPTASPEDKFKARQIINNQNMAYTGTEPAINKRAGTLNVGSGFSQMPSYSQNEIKGYLTDEQQSPVPASLNAGVPASDIAKDLIRPTTLPQGAQAMADRIAMGRTPPAPTASFDFANPNQVATDVLDNPARANTDPDLWKWATDYRSQHPQQRRSAPAPTQTPYAQAAAPATQTQPAQEEEKDLTLAERMKEFRDATGENKGIAALQSRLAERESRLAKEEDRAPAMALMQAGLAVMGGTSPNFLTNLALMQTGLQAYTHSMNKLEDARDKSFEIQAKLEEAQHAEQLAVAKYGLESVQADKQAKATAKLEQKKLDAQMDVAKLKDATDRLQISATAGNAANSLGMRQKELEGSENYLRAQYANLYDKAQNETNPNKKAQLENQLKGLERSISLGSSRANQTLTPSTVLNSYDEQIKGLLTQLSNPALSSKDRLALQNELNAYKKASTDIMKQHGYEIDVGAGLPVGGANQTNNIQSQATEIARKRGLIK